MQEPGAGPVDYRQHSLRPLVLDAGRAHREQLVRYDAEGTAWLRHPEHDQLGLPASLAIGPERQFCAIRATFEDLQRPLLGAVRSPLADEKHSLRDLYEQEVRSYGALAAEAYSAGAFEPDYGSYVFDHVARQLYLVAPERWHRLALVASNSKLVTDPEGQLSWVEIRRRLEGAVIGFAGASVGGNLLEGWLREARPKCVKLADPDRVELTNFNRAERVSLRHFVGSRGQRVDLRDSRQATRVSKAEYLAYEQQLVDPYLDVYVYKQGLTPGNLSRFLLGDGGAEPPIDILVEEMDNLELKVAVRQLARQHRIDVLMLTDYGHIAHVGWNPFKDHPDAPLALSGQEDALLAALAAIRAGDRRRIFDFVENLCGGKEFLIGTYGAFVREEGEQPVASVPQSGATAMAAGGIGGKELAMRVLGHAFPKGNRVVYDFAARHGQQAGLADMTPNHRHILRPPEPPPASARVSASDPFELWRLSPLRPEDFAALGTRESDLSPAQLRHLAAYNVLAPSSHNTVPQRFLFPSEGNTIDICIDREVVLAASDPTGRQAAISLGCGIANLLHAARRYELEAEVEVFEDPSAPVLPHQPGQARYARAARIRLRRGAAAGPEAVLRAMLERRTVRAEYNASVALPQELASTLTALMGSHYPELGFHLLSDAATIGFLGDLQELAESAVLSREDFTTELGQWLIENDSGSPVGMRGREHGLSDAMTRGVRARLVSEIRLAPEEVSALAHGSNIAIRSSSAVAIIVAPRDDLRHRVLAGRAFEDLVLALHQRAFVTSMHASMTELETASLALQARLGARGRPIVVFRMGQALEPRDSLRPHSARPSVTDVTLSETLLSLPSTRPAS